MSISSQFSSNFGALARSRKYKTQRPTYAQKKIHIDLLMTGLDANKRAFTVSVDVKLRANKKASDQWHWLELRDPQGASGWIYQEADFVAFERRKDFVIVNRKNLVDWINTTPRIRYDLPYVAETWLAKYRLFSRPGKKDSITQVKSQDLLGIPGTHTWVKLSSKSP